LPATLFALGQAPTPPDLFGQLSTRAFVGTGENVFISGFTVTGAGTKKVLVRALGPSLTGVSGQLADPTLELRDNNGLLLALNNDWRDTQEAEIIATGQQPTNDLECAIVATVSPGNYTALIAGRNNTTGVGKADIIDVDTSANSQLAAILSRALAGTGDDVIVGEFRINGPQSQKVLIRGVGPSLIAQGLPNALADPTLELHEGNGNTLVSNNDWQENPAQASEITATGLAPTDNRESAMVVTLLPGSYTAAVAGVCGTTGTALVEIYNLGLAGNTMAIPSSSPLPCAPTPTPPPITSPLTAMATVGQLFVYQFEATGATSLGVSNPPPGMGFDSALHAIVGKPTTAGTFQTTLSATNGAGTTNETLTTTVSPTPASGPVIISSTSATGRIGRPFSFQLQTSGGSSATHFTVTGLPPGFNVDPPTGFISGTPASAGNFNLAVSAIDGATINHATLQLTFTSDLTVPIITSATSALLTPGQFFSYTITADANATFRYLGTDGIVHQGPSSAGLPAGLSFDGIDTISGTFTPAFEHDGEPRGISGVSGGIVTNVQLFSTDPSGTGTFPLINFVAAPGTVNISTRLAVRTGENVLIGGFIIQGTGTTKALIRAIGPSLPGVTDALPDPTLELRDGTGALLGSNNNWSDTQSYAITSTGIPPTNDLESAIVAFLSPGSYTCIVSGNNGTTGVGSVEVYDLGIAAFLPAGTARLANISTRGFADTGEKVVIGGFIVFPQSPATSTRVVVRAIGPSLPVPGALGDPTLELHDGNGGLIDANDNWRSDHEAEIIATMIPPSNDLESAIVRNLMPGAYTAIVQGSSGTTGVALVEVYSLP